MLGLKFYCEKRAEGRGKLRNLILESSKKTVQLLKCIETIEV